MLQAIQLLMLLLAQQLQASATLDKWQRVRVLNATVGTTYQANASSREAIAFSFSYRQSAMQLQPFRVSVEAVDASDSDWPLLMSARQKRSVLSWSLPFLFVEAHGRRTLYESVSRTLCPPEADATLPQAPLFSSRHMIVEVGTQSARPVGFSLRAEVVPDFRLRAGRPVRAQVHPSRPVYHWFDFADTERQSVQVRAVANDSACMVLSVQRGSCPVLDSPTNFQRGALRQTVQRNGVVNVNRKEFPTFFVVLLTFPTTKECRSFYSDPEVFENATKSVHLEIVELPEANVPAIVALTAACLLAVSAACICAACCIARHRGFADVQPLEPQEQLQHLSLAALNTKRSFEYDYLGYTIVIGIFFGVPVLELMLTLLHDLKSTGNLDNCFYNFKCSHFETIGDSLVIHAFNSVVSNIGFVILGATFIVICAVKQRWYNAAALGDRGVSEKFGIYYAIGAAVMLEGVMSACYHVCPSYNSFQFDTAFMLMITGLLVLLLYSRRHPDACASAPVAFVALGSLMLANTAGILLSRSRPRAAFALLGFGILAAWVSLAGFAYFLGRRGVARALRRRQWPQELPPEAPSGRLLAAGLFRRLHPRRPNAFALLAIGSVFNVSVAATCFWKAAGVSDQPSLSFAELLLTCVIGNFALYLLLYFCMKLRTAACDRSLALKLAMTCATLATVACSLWLYFQSPTDWNAAPDDSRGHNHSCLLASFYDAHDLWHLVSAIGLFCLLLLLLCIDCDDDSVPQYQLEVF